MATGKQPKRSQQGGGRAGDFTLPSRFVAEKALHDIHRAMEGHEFGNIKEANAFLASLTGPGLKRALKDVPPPSPQEEAQQIAYDAMEAPTRTRAVALAKRALAKDPDCVDALVTLAAGQARTEEDLIAGLERAVATGERSLGEKCFEENKGHFWGILETRPYMRALQQLADLLLDVGRDRDAMRHFEALLALNPNDNQGVRDTLLGCYLATEDLKGARRLLQEYGDDDSAVFNWGRTLERFLSRDFQEAERALQHARKNNRFVEKYLTARKKPPRAMPDSYMPGSDEEALVCLDCLTDAWVAHPEALIWLLVIIDGARPQSLGTQANPEKNPIQPHLF
jgi:tetratricopeptide (TPR) repeat protein